MYLFYLVPPHKSSPVPEEMNKAAVLSEPELH